MLCAPFLGHISAVANICNIMLMRNHELWEGIEVKNKDGEVVGSSVVAARKVSSTFLLWNKIPFYTSQVSIVHNCNWSNYMYVCVHIIVQLSSVTCTCIHVALSLIILFMLTCLFIIVYFTHKITTLNNE